MIRILNLIFVGEIRKEDGILKLYLTTDIERCNKSSQDASSSAKPRMYVCSSIYAHYFNAIMATVMQIVIKLMRR